MKIIDFKTKKHKEQENIKEIISGILEDEGKLNGTNLILTIREDGTSAFTITQGEGEINSPLLLGYVKIMEQAIIDEWLYEEE